MTSKPVCCDVVRGPVAVAPCRPGGSTPRRLAAGIGGMFLACLPLLPAFPVILVVEVRPREDAAEAPAEALFALATSRVLHLRAS